MRQLSIILICFAFFAQKQALAQTASVKGTVYTKDDGEPVLFTNVYFKGTTIGATTDEHGYFNMTKIPAGTYTLVISYMGYDTLSEVLQLASNTTLNKKYFLEKGAISLDEVEITATSQAKTEDTRVSVEKIDPKVINKLPSVGEPDLAQYLQVLPGVVFTGDQGGQLYIRGGTPVQNKLLMDGMIVYNPFHSIGLFSVFDNDIIRNADVYTGGFGAEYGGRVSSIMDITTRDGNKRRLSGKAGFSTFGAKALLEGPLVKLKDDNGSSMSYLFSFKNSYLPQSSKILYSYVDTAGLPFSFTDYYGKLSFNSANGSKINLFGYNYSDNVVYPNITELGWKSWGAGSNFLIIPNASSALIEGNFAYSKYNIASTGSMANSDRSSGVSSFNGGFQISTFSGRNEFKIGIELIGLNTLYKFVDDFGNHMDQEENTSEFALFGKTKWVWWNKKLIFEPSMRVHNYLSLSETQFEPRFALKYNVHEKFRLKASGGYYSQNLIAANSDRDIVNLFYGFLVGPEDLQETYKPYKGAEEQDLKTKLQKAKHLISGFELDLPLNIDLNVEAYIKQFTNLTNINRDRVFSDENGLNSDKPDFLKKQYVVETGFAKGIDFKVSYEKKGFSFWTVYSLGFNRRWDGIREYFPIFDRRHNVNMVTSYTFGKKKNWEINARWNFGSGFPFTQTAGYYQKVDMGQSVYDPYYNANGTLSYIPGELNAGRLPHYHRMDLGMKYTYKWTDRVTLDVMAGITNVYNRANIFYFDRIKQTRKDQLPLLPNCNISFTF